MAETTADKVADYLIHFAHEHGDPITNLKLQKLLYYAQAWYLALYNKPLFDEPLEAWVHGPVQPEVWRKYKKYAWSPIPRDPEPAALPPRVRKHLDEIMAVYGVLTAWELERTTHHEAPWLNARQGLPSDLPSEATISLEDMKRFYRDMANENQATGVTHS